MKKILLFLKRIIFSYVLLYGYNLISINFNLVIPINFITVGLITFFGFPSLVALVLFKFVVL